MKYFALLIIAVLYFSHCSPKQEISTGSLLEEMINRKNLAEYPDPYYTLKQFSSYDRKSINPDKSGWFANADRSQFLRKETNKGRREFVLFDAEGPGAIVRFWITVALYEGNGILRFYIDHQDEAILEGEVLSLMSGGGIIDGPLATSVSQLTDYSQRGHNLYLPIPYALHCKITYESEGIDEVPGAASGEAFYYNINYRSYKHEVKVASFSKNDVQLYASKLNHVQRSIIDNDGGTPEKIVTQQINKSILKAGQSVHLDVEGNQAIHRINVKIDALNLEQALRSTVIDMEFDGHKTVWCPLGDFFGTGYKISPFKTWYSEVLNDGTMSCRWIMPFMEKASVSIINYGNADILMEQFAIEYTDYPWTENTMHFGAGWHELNRIDSKKESYDVTIDGSGSFDINYVELRGKGILVGNAVTVFNTTDAWWGEGDEKIFVDHEKFPSHFGTGSEDFYGYAWSNPNTFDHPFIAQPDGSGAMESGYVVNLRYRALDAIPFSSNLKFDMEMWHQANTVVNYAPASYWYMLPGGKNNLPPVPEQAQKPVSLTRNDFYLDGYDKRNIFINETLVQINGRDNGFEIRYTLDGSDPGRQSDLYDGPFRLSHSATVKSRGFSPKGYSTEILVGEFINQQPIAGITINNPQKGLKFQYFVVEEVLQSTRQLAALKVNQTGTTPSLHFPNMVLPLKFGLIFSGFIHVKKAGLYRFSTITNDGSMLYIHDQLVVNNDGPHGARERSGEIALAPGYHPLELEYIQIGGSRHFETFIEGPGISRRKILDDEIAH